MKKFDQDTINLKRIFIDITDGKHLDAIVLGQIIFRSGLKNGKSNITFKKFDKIWIDMNYKDWYEDVRIHRSTMTRILKRLEHQGFITTMERPDYSTKTRYISVNPERIIQAIELILCGSKKVGNVVENDKQLVPNESNDLTYLIQSNIILYYNNINNNNEFIFKNINSCSFSPKDELEKINLKAKQVESIFNTWNQHAKDHKGINKHKSINSELSKSTKNWNHLVQPVWYSIFECLGSNSYDEIIKAINNYFKVYSSDEYFYSYKFQTLPVFLFSDRGLSQFKSDVVFNNYKSTTIETNPYNRLRNQYKPVIHRFDLKNILNTNTQSYMGISIKICKNLNIVSVLKELIEESNNELMLRHYIRLEECIAAAFYQKDCGIEKLDGMIKLHSNYRRFISVKYEEEINLYYR